MAIWFRKDKNLKWHIATYGGSIAECGKNVGVAAAYADERMSLEVDRSEGVQDLCQACLNSIKRGREGIKQLDKEYEERKQRKHTGEASPNGEPLSSPQQAEGYPAE